MKPFNLKEALEGRAVITRDGREVTQLMEFKLLSTIGTLMCKPLRGVVDGAVRSWKITGDYANGYNNDLDLFMKPIKKEGWVNVYPGIGANRTEGIFTSERMALEGSVKGRIDTVKIEWKE